MATSPSLKSLLQDAKRAHELIDDIDLQAVVQHDGDQVDKVVNGLAELNAMTGVPDTQSAIDQAQPDVNSALEEAGYAGRVGCVFFTGSEEPMKPFSFVPHRVGLPSFDHCVAPDHSPIDGVHGIFVTARGIFTATVANPTTDNQWRIEKSVPYDCVDEMLETIQRFISRPRLHRSQRRSGPGFSLTVTLTFFPLGRVHAPDFMAVGRQHRLKLSLLILFGMTLLIGCARKPETADVLPLLRALPKSQQFDILQGGRSAGVAVLTVHSTAQQVVFEQHVEYLPSAQAIPLRWRERRTFSLQAPFPLIAISHHAQGKKPLDWRRDNPSHTAHPAADLTLFDELALTQLAQTDPQPHSSHQVRTLQVHADEATSSLLVSVAPVQWQVAAVNPLQLTGADGLRSMALDQNGHPLSINLGNQLILRRRYNTEDRSSQSPPGLPEVDYKPADPATSETQLSLVPVNQPLSQHRTATQLRYSATTASGTASQHWIDAGIANPDGTVSVHIQSSITNAHHTQLRALIDAVHQRLRYDGTHSPASLERALHDGLGDCTEFATLFSRYASEAGFKNRIRTGLAYLGDAVQALGHHQWNEVYLDGTWVAVDPTWQQIPADVTHLPLPQSGDAGLAAYAALPDLYLKVLN